MHAQSIVNADLPGLRTLQYSTNGGGSYTSIQVSGWRPFKDYLAQFSSSLPNSWTLAYNADRDRVEFTPGSGSLQVVLESQSMADLFGNSTVNIGNSSSTITLPEAPMGVCPIDHLHVADPV